MLKCIFTEMFCACTRVQLYNIEHGYRVLLCTLSQSKSRPEDLRTEGAPRTPGEEDADDSDSMPGTQPARCGGALCDGRRLRAPIDDLGVLGQTADAARCQHWGLDWHL